MPGGLPPALLEAQRQSQGDPSQMLKRRSVAASVLSQRSTAPRSESSSLEGDLLRLERQNVSLMRALARDEEFRNELEQMLWHSDTAQKASETPRLQNMLVNSKIQILEERNKSLKRELERSQTLEEAAREKLADALGQPTQPYPYHGAIQTSSKKQQGETLEKEAIVAELAAVKQEFEEYKMHEHIIKMSLQGMVSKFQTRCSSLQAEVLAQDSQPVSSKADWEEEKRSIVSHNRVVKAQMQERIDRLTALLMQERQARQNAYDANMKAMTKLEQIAVSDNNPKGVALQMDQYIAELHREMGALRDTVILLQNDNAELLNERSHLRGQRQQMQKAHQKAMKEQEAIFLADVKSKNLEIERLQVQIRDLAADKAKLKATAGQSGGRVGDKKAVTEKELEILERRIEDMSRWKAISDDSIITMQSRLDAGGGSSVEISQQLADAQGVIMDLEGKVSILSEQLDRERKKVTELEASVYDLSLSTKTLHAFMDVDTQSKTEALEWHEQDSARIKELEAKLGILKGSMLNVENDLGNARVSTEVLEEQHRKAVRELEQEIELLRRRCSDSEARKSSVVVKKVGNANALLELQAAMESATERSLYFESREAMLVQDKKHLQNQLDLLMEEKMSLEKAQELLLRENAHLKQEQAAVPGLRKHEREAEKDRRLAECHRKVNVLEVQLKEAEADNEKKHRDLNALRDRLLLLDRMKQNSDQTLEREKANGANVAILSDLLKECEHNNRNLEAQLKLANDELQEAKKINATVTMELREVNTSRCKAEDLANDLKYENSNMSLELFKARKEAREFGEEAHKVQRRNKDLERENEELHTQINHLVIEATQHEGKTEANEREKLAKHAAKIEAELKFMKSEYHQKVLCLEDAQVALEEAEASRKLAAERLKELEVTTKEMAHVFNECKDEIETQLKEVTSKGEQSSEKLSDMTRKLATLTATHHKDIATIEELRTNARKMEFDYEISKAQVEQTSQRLADALDRNSSMQVHASKLEEDNREQANEMELLQIELQEALRMQKELEKNIQEEKVGSIGSTNIAWQKLEKLAKDKADADREIESLKLELEQTLEIQEKLQLSARESEKMWSQNCRDLEERLGKLESERSELRMHMDESKDAQREDDDTIDAIATELQNCRKHARDMELQKETIALEMNDAIELAKRLTEELDEVKHQCDLRDMKIDQVVLELEEKETELDKVRAAFKSMGEVAQNQQAQITLLQAEREKDLERTREMADQELLEAQQEVAELKRELEHMHEQIQYSQSSNSNEQEKALMTARLAKEQYEDLKMSTEDKVKNAIKQLEVEQLAKLQLEYCVAELEVQMARDKAEYHASINEERAIAQEELGKEQEQHHEALDLLAAYQVKQSQLLSVQRRTIYNVIGQRTRRFLTRFFDKWCLHKNAIVAMDASMGIWVRRWSDREVIRSFCSWANHTMNKQHLRYLAQDVGRRHGRRFKRTFFRGWITVIEHEKVVERGVDVMWDRNEKRLMILCLRAWGYKTAYLTRSHALLRWAHQRAQFYLKSVAFHGLATNSYTELNKQTVSDAKKNYEVMTAQYVKEVQAANERANQVLTKQGIVITVAANRMVRAKHKQLLTAVWRHWRSSTKNSKRLGIVAATVVHRATFRKKQRNMQHWLFTAKAATRLWLEGESCLQKLHYKRRHHVLQAFKENLSHKKIVRRLLSHVAWSRDRKRRLDGFDAFAGQLIRRDVKLHIDAVESETKRKVERLQHETKVVEERAERRVAQTERESDAKIESSERRASNAERDLKKTQQMLNDVQAQVRMLEESMGDNKSDMIEQIKELSHERQFADQRYEETAEFLRQKEAELARVETLLAESVAASRRHTELYEKGQGQIHDLTLQIQDLTAQIKAKDLEWKSEKVDMEMMYDKQLAQAKSDHFDQEEEIARLKDKNALLEEGLKAAGESTGNASSKLVNQIDELKRKCTQLQDELTRTKENATGKGTVTLRLIKAAYAAANNAYDLKGCRNKHRAFFSWRRLTFFRKAAPDLTRYRRGVGRLSKMAVRTVWHTWLNELKAKKNARVRAAAANARKNGETLDVCWGALTGLLHDRHVREDYAKAWRSTFSEMEAEKFGSMRLSSELESLRQVLAEEQEARSVAEHQLEQSLELGESLQLRLLETEGKLNQLKLQKDIPMMAHEDLQRYKAECECRLQLAEAKAADARADADALLDKFESNNYQCLERDNMLKDIDNLTDANQGLKRALDEAQQEVDDLQADMRLLREDLADHQQIKQLLENAKVEAEELRREAEEEAQQRELCEFQLEKLRMQVLSMRTSV